MKAIMCDGCGKPAEDHVSAGFPKMLDYCMECFAVLEEFREARDALHDDISGKWTAGLEKLKKKYPLREMPDA